MKKILSLLLSLTIMVPNTVKPENGLEKAVGAIALVVVAAVSGSYWWSSSSTAASTTEPQANPFPSTRIELNLERKKNEEKKEIEGACGEPSLLEKFNEIDDKQEPNNSVLNEKNNQEETPQDEPTLSSTEEEKKEKPQGKPLQHAGEMTPIFAPSSKTNSSLLTKIKTFVQSSNHVVTSLHEFNDY